MQLLDLWIQVVVFMSIGLIQYTKMKTSESKMWVAVKLAFNFQIFKVYLSVVLSEAAQIKRHFDKTEEGETFGKKGEYLQFLEDNLFYLSLQIYVGVLFILLFFRTLQQNSIKLKHLTKQPIAKIVEMLLKSLVQTSFFQGIIFLIVLYFHIKDPIDQMKFLKLSYIRMLFMLSAISSTGPILQILIERPILHFFSSYDRLMSVDVVEYTYESVVQSEMDSQSEASEQSDMSIHFDPQSILQFDEEIVQKKESICLRGYKLVKSIFNFIRKNLRLLYRLAIFIYSFIQMLFAFLVILALVFIIIEILNPSVNILGSLNAVDFFSSKEIGSGPIDIAHQEMMDRWQPILFFLFKIVFIVIMYLSSQHGIVYKERKGIINDVNKVVLIVRKGLLNFSLIGLLTTLYPNITMTINNSDCFKDLKYSRGSFHKAHSNQQYNLWDETCPVTVVGLVKMKLFEGTFVTAVGLSVLVMYITYAACVVARISTLRRSD